LCPHLNRNDPKNSDPIHEPGRIGQWTTVFSGTHRHRSRRNGCIFIREYRVDGPGRDVFHFSRSHYFPVFGPTAAIRTEPSEFAASTHITRIFRLPVAKSIWRGRCPREGYWDAGSCFDYCPFGPCQQGDQKGRGSRKISGSFTLNRIS